MFGRRHSLAWALSTTVSLSHKAYGETSCRSRGAVTDDVSSSSRSDWSGSPNGSVRSYTVFSHVS